MPPEILTVITGASPIAEVRVAIPLAVAVFKFSLVKAFFWGVLGNLLPIVPLLFFFYYFSDFLSQRSVMAKGFFQWLFNLTRRRHEEHFKRFTTMAEIHNTGGIKKEFWKAAALFIFVAIPLPLTGVWGGTVAAFIFGIPIGRAALAIALGVCAAGLIVAFITSGAINLSSFL